MPYFGVRVFNAFFYVDHFDNAIIVGVVIKKLGFHAFIMRSF